MNITYQSSGASYWTPFYGVHRWDRLLSDKPGTYALVLMPEVLQLFRMAANGEVRHPTCVVDDFGTLVRVPSEH